MPVVSFRLGKTHFKALVELAKREGVSPNRAAKHVIEDRLTPSWPNIPDSGVPFVDDDEFLPKKPMGWSSATAAREVLNVLDGKSRDVQLDLLATFLEALKRQAT